jgi:hypothetical protein
VTGFLRWIELDADVPSAGYPYTLPVVAGLRAAGRLRLDPAVTFLTGDNGTGKSTLIEAIAVAAGFNPEGGSVNFRFSTRATESPLGRYLRLVRAPGKPRTGYFLRAESFYNVASEIDRLGAGGGYGGRSLHERSHGESFLDLATHRFGPHAAAESGRDPPPARDRFGPWRPGCRRRPAVPILAGCRTPPPTSSMCSPTSASGRRSLGPVTRGRRSSPLNATAAHSSSSGPPAVPRMRWPPGADTLPIKGSRW